MVDTRRYKDWFDKGRQDLRSALILFEHDGDMWVVAFHCQQSVEKYLKGYLINSSGFLVEGHNLYTLCKKCIANDESFKDLLKDCGYLANYYIETRYPAEDPLNVSIDEAEICIEIAKSVIKLIDKILEL